MLIVASVSQVISGSSDDVAASAFWMGTPDACATPPQANRPRRGSSVLNFSLLSLFPHEMVMERKLQKWKPRPNREEVVNDGLSKMQLVDGKGDDFGTR